VFDFEDVESHEWNLEGEVWSDEIEEIGDFNKKS
jgi:hypothetical protein